LKYFLFLKNVLASVLTIRSYVVLDFTRACAALAIRFSRRGMYRLSMLHTSSGISAALAIARNHLR